MAGRPVFKAAKSGDLLFRAFTASQRLGVAIAPNKIVETMFKESPKADKELLLDPYFKSALIKGLKYSLGQDRAQYRKAIRHFVEPWADCLGDVTCPIELHHGSADNWAPLAMSHALKESMNCDVQLITYEGLGHYSTLHTALPGVLSRL